MPSASSRPVWVIIPAYNEQKHIRNVLAQTKKYTKNIVVVDDGSSDKTADLVAAAKVRLIRLKKNQGKGIALRTGCDYARRHGAQVIITMDADGQHKPSMIPQFVQRLRKQNVDVVFGARRLSKTMPLLFRIGNAILTIWTILLFGIRVQDSQCGFRAFTARAYKKVRWIANRYAVESEVVVRTARAKLRYTELGIPTVYFEKYKGTTPFDGIKIMLHMLRLRFSL